MPKAKYRMLKVGEILDKGDTFRCRDGVWRPTVYAGTKIPRCFKNYYRRPLRRKHATR